MKGRHIVFPTVPILVFFLIMTGCASEDAYPVHSHVEGTLSIRAEVDSTEDFSGFRISVLTQKDGDVDTLGTATTSRSGRFTMEVHAPEMAIYPIVVERSGTTLTIGEFVAAPDDTVDVRAAYPLGSRPLRIVSLENAAWTAYRNAKAMHNNSMMELLQSEGYSPDDLGKVVAQTSNILWSIRNTYPSTMGADLAMAESIVMIEGWNDRLVIERFSEMEDDNPSIVEVIRAVRRSISRLDGAGVAVNMMRGYLTKVSEEDQAGIRAEIVLAFSDSGHVKLAVDAAMDLKRRHPESEWAEWASRATYDLENLQPGMMAPTYSVTTREFEDLDTSSMEGVFVILEFFDPAEQIWQRDLAVRDAMTRALHTAAFQTIAISVEPDPDINAALFDGASHPGHFVFSSEGMEQRIVKNFNVNVVPTRFLIDPSGIIINKYIGPELVKLEQDLAAIVGTLNEIANSVSGQGQ